MLRRLAGRTVLTLPADLATDEGAAILVVQCERAGEIIPSLNENESYSLEVKDKQARLVAPTVVGALRGLETFLQLLQGDRDGYYLPAIKIQDQPRFPGAVCSLTWPATMSQWKFSNEIWMRWQQSSSTSFTGI